jgi:hypothetical protein
MKFLRGGGTVNIDHLRSGQDDVVNSAAGAIVSGSRIEAPTRDEIQFGISYCPESLVEQLERESIDWLLDRKPKEKEKDENEEDQEEQEDRKKVVAVISRGWKKTDDGEE